MRKRSINITVAMGLCLLMTSCTKFLGFLFWSDAPLTREASWMDEALRYPMYFVKNAQNKFILCTFYPPEHISENRSGQGLMENILPVNGILSPQLCAKLLHAKKYKNIYLITTQPLPFEYKNAIEKTCSISPMQDTSHLPLIENWNVSGKIREKQMWTRQELGYLNIPKSPKYIYLLIYNNK